MQASLVGLLELRRPVLGQEVELPLVRHYDRDLAIADDLAFLSPLRSQANLVAGRLHRGRDLVADL